MGPKGSKEIAVTANDSAKTVASLVNAQASSTGVTATATTFVKISGMTAAAATTLTLQGGGSAVALSFTIAQTSDLTAMKDAINSNAGTTGVTAAFDGTDKSALILNEADGDNILLKDFVQGTAIKSSLRGFSLRKEQKLSMFFASISMSRPGINALPGLDLGQ